jgi:hypothetical protein
MGLFTKTVTVLVPVQVVVTNPIGGIIALILTIVFWKEILSLIVIAIALILLVALIKWFTSISGSFSAGAKIFSYAAIVIIIFGSSGYVLEKINGKNSEETDEPLNVNDNESHSYRNNYVTNNNSTEDDNSSTSVDYYLHLFDSYKSAQLSKQFTNEFDQNINNSSDQIKLTEAQNLFSDGESHYFNHENNLYKVEKLINNQSTGKIQEVVFSYVKNNEVHDITVRYNETGTSIKEISDTIKPENKPSDLYKLFIAIPFALICFWIAFRGFFKRKKKNIASNTINKTNSNDSIQQSQKNQIERTSIEPQIETSQRNKAQILSKDGFLSIEFDAPISAELISMVRSLVNTFPKKNTKKIRINGDGKNIRQLDLDDIKLLIPFLEKQSIHIKNKRKFQE